jgi:hypothetical protein
MDREHDEAEQAGVEDGQWWAERKASKDELTRLSNWAAQMEFDGVDPLETGEEWSSPYTPAERVYFVLAPEDDGDRPAAKWFWEPLFGWDKYGKRDPNGRYLRGFLLGAVGYELE